MSKKKTWIADKVKVRSEGDPLQPDGLLNKNFLKRMKRQSGNYYYQALYQGEPTAKGSGFFEEEFFQYYSSLPKKIKHRVITIDAAQEAHSRADYSVLQYWVETETGYYLVDNVRKKWKFPELEENVKSFYNKYRLTNKVIIEPKSNGAALLQNLKSKTKIPVQAVDSKFLSLKKEERCNQIIGQVETGNVFFPENATWLWDFKTELLDFNKGEYDDQVDCLVHAIYYLVYRKKIIRIRSL